MAYTFGDADAAGRRTTQYFEIFANAAIYHDGWLAGTTPERLPWEPNATDMDVLTANWELYNIDEDFSQTSPISTAQSSERPGLSRLRVGPNRSGWTAVGGVAVSVAWVRVSCGNIVGAMARWVQNGSTAHRFDRSGAAPDLHPAGTASDQAQRLRCFSCST